jgi:hypothetical protein
MEYLGKRMVYGGVNASCVPPDQYGNRFVAFMAECFRSNKDANYQSPTKGLKR